MLLLFIAISYSANTIILSFYIMVMYMCVCVEMSVFSPFQVGYLFGKWLWIAIIIALVDALVMHFIIARAIP